MKKVLIILFLCVMVPGIGYCEDIWTMNCWDSNQERVEKTGNIGICFDKKKSNYEVKFIFDRMCKGEIQYGNIIGTGKGNQKEMTVTTKEGSKFLLKLDKENFDIYVTPNISPNQKVIWNKTDKCKKEIGKLSDSNINTMKSSKIHILEYGLN